LCALTINWGAVSDTGYAAKDADVAKHLDRIGVKGFSSKSAFGILKELLSPSVGSSLRLEPTIQVAVADVDWQKWSKAHATGNSPRYSYLTGSAGSEQTDKKEGKQENKSDFLNQLKNISADEREKHIHEFLCTLVSQVLGRDPSKSLDNDKGFFELGMDSMMTMELRNRLISQLKLTLPTTLAFKYPNIKALTGYLVQELSASETSETVYGAEPHKQQEISEIPPAIIEQVQQLSEDEAEMSLLDELEKLEIGN